VAGPDEGGGPSRLRTEPAGLGRDEPAEASELSGHARVRIFISPKCKSDRHRHSLLVFAEVTMILYDVLRLYPAAIRLERQTSKEIELGGLTYPPGVILSLPIVFMHSPRPRQGRVERKRRRVQAGSRGSPTAYPSVQGLAGVLPVRLGAADLRRPELRVGRGQAGAQHGPAALVVQPLTVLRPRAVPGFHSANTPSGP
jgi:hypothetical protein